MKIEQYTDIHTHILPGIDDGAVNITMTLRMIEIAKENGICNMIATPHHIPGEAYDLLELDSVYESVKSEFAKFNMNLFLGNEIYLNSGTLDSLLSGKALTLAKTRYVLIECSPAEGYRNLYNGLRDLLLNGYIPILAHVERYHCLIRDIKRIEELISLGCYIQVNASSLSGSMFSSELRFIKKLLKLDEIHFIASDCHNTKERSPRLADGVNRCKRWLTDAQLQKIFYENPKKLLENKLI